jgi:hypothetical protein
LTETCDGLDNDCAQGIDDGLPRTEFFQDGDGDGVGAGPVTSACKAPPSHVAVSGDCDDGNINRTPGKTEQCNGFDDDCDEQTDEGFDKEWYLDSDGDTYGDQNQKVTSCERPSDKHVRVTNNRFDCKDDAAERYPGAPEKCNEVDDNCSGVADEPFITGGAAKGAVCLTDNLCSGVYVCNSAQTATACNAPAPVQHYVDRDGDGEGAAGSTAQRVCPGTPPPAGWVTNQLDCDDADIGTESMAGEVCDAIDNNCNGQFDEGASCGGSLRRLHGQEALGGDGHNWRSVAVDPTDGYPVWVAGMDGILAVRKTRGAAFVGFDGSCGTNGGERATDWYAAWVNPANGNVFLAGENTRLAEHDGTTCVRFVDVPLAVGVAEHPFTSIMGVGNPLTLFIVSREGRLYSWQPGSSTTQLHNFGGYYRGVYVLSPDLLLAVGTASQASPSVPGIQAYNSTNWTSPTPHTLTGMSGYNGSLHAIWMESDTEGYAVGDNGLVLRKDGAAASWTRMPAPTGATPDFSSVAVHPVSKAAYVVDKAAAGGLRRLTSLGWAVPPAFRDTAGASDNPDRPLYDIAMSSTGEFWLVGDQGRVYLYPH